MRRLAFGIDFATRWKNSMWSNFMLRIHNDRISDVAVVQCGGLLVDSDAAFKLRNAVTAEPDARVIVLDLSEVASIEGGGLGMLLFLERWALDHEIELKVFNPSNSVRRRITEAQSVMDFEISTIYNVSTLVPYAEHSAQTHF
jgi:anti-anti-sigma regulatory factor